MKGTVKSYNRRSGYGFIKGTDEKEYFVHRIDIVCGFLMPGQEVEFKVSCGNRGPYAEEVRIWKSENGSTTKIQ